MGILLSSALGPLINKPHHWARCVKGLELGWGRGDPNARDHEDCHDHYDKTLLTGDGIRRCRGDRALINNTLI